MAAIILYYVVHEYINYGVLVSKHTLLLTVFFSIAIVEYLYAHKLGQISESNNDRVWFRVVTNLIDNVLLAVVIILMGKMGTPLFVVYLWITFGIGIRYGGAYLILSAVLNILSFTIVSMVDPIWTSDEVIYITIGIFLSFMILPAYVYVLISKLALALESEKSANQAKQSLLAYMNHELRTPLNSILNITEFIRTHELPVKIYSMLDIIRASVITQLKTVNNILDIAKLEVGQNRLHICKFDLYSTVREVRQLLLPQAHKKGIKLYHFIDPACEQYLIGDVDKIKQILINLVSNAVRFTEQGYVRLVVTPGKTSISDQELVFEIIDTGIGIAEETKKDIFKPYVQGDISVTKKHGGTGLGLAISDELAKLMGGSLVLECSTDKGTKFTFKSKFKFEITNRSLALEGLTVLFLSQDDRIKKFIEFYRDNGIKVLSPYFEHGFTSENEKKEAIRIVFINNKDQANESAMFGNDANEENISIIEVLDNEDSNLMNYNAVTAINEKTSSKVLLNALIIGETLLPQTCSLITKLPRIDRVLNILLAEDDPTLREIHKIIFGASGHMVTLVKDGTEALNTLLHSSYDLVILDYHMPDMTGVEVAQRFRKITPNRIEKIILLTADVDTTASSSDETFVLKLMKPIEPGQLLRSIYGLFDSPDTTIVNKEIDFRVIANNDIGELGYEYGNLQFTNQIIEWFGQDYSIELIKIYRKEMNQLIAELYSSQLTEEFSKMHSILHKMQGVSLSLGATELGNSITIILNSKIDGQPKVIITKSEIDNLVNMHQAYMANLPKYLIG